MDIRIVFSSTAKSDLERSYYWYEERSAGLGVRFLDVIDHGLQLIRINPEGFFKKNNDFREFFLTRFSFVIIYQFDRKNQKVFVLRIFHTKRNPKKRYEEL